MDAYGRLYVGEDLSIGREYCLTTADVRAFEAMLRETFPDIRFVRKAHWYRRVDGKLVDQAPPNLVVPYVESLADPDEPDIEAWLEPEGWEPEWWPEYFGSNPRHCRWLIINRPRLRFSFDRGGLRPSAFTDLTRSRISALYEHGDKEHLSFVHKVIRLSQKMTDQVLDHYPLGDKPPLRAIRSYIWAGPDAMRWCREAPERRLDGTLRPPEPAKTRGETQCEAAPPEENPRPPS